MLRHTSHMARGGEQVINNPRVEKQRTLRRVVPSIRRSPRRGRGARAAAAGTVAPRGVTRQVLNPVRGPRRHGGWRRLDTLRVAHARPLRCAHSGNTSRSWDHRRITESSPGRCAAPQLVAGLVAVIMPYCIRPLVKARCMISRHHASRMTFHHSFGRRMTGHGSHTPTQTE